MTGTTPPAHRTTPVQAPSASPRRNNNFNLLRLLLAVLVIFSHSFMLTGKDGQEVLLRLFHTMTFGDLAVNGFFLISGFLIVQSWLSRPRLYDFFKSRVLRIYPAFLVASIVSVFVVGPLGAGGAGYFRQLDLGRFTKDLLLLNMPAVPPVFAGQPCPLVNGSLWTIEYEFRCYMFAALIGLCGIFLMRRAWAMLAASVVVIALASDLYEIFNRIPSYSWLAFITIDPVVFAKFFAYFCAGGFFYVFRDRIHFKTVWAMAAVVILIPCLFWIKTADLALATLGAYVLFWFAFTDFPRLAWFRTCPDISYGVYLYGWPAQKIFAWYFPGISPWLLFPAALGLSCVLGLLSCLVVERPFLALKRPSEPKKASA